MRRLSNAEIRDFRSRLQKWSSLAEVRSVFDEAVAILGNEMMIQSGLEFLREAWIAEKVGGLLGAQMARLRTTTPDLELMIDGQPRLFEITEADDPERKRGDEYKALRNASDPQPEYDTEAAHRAAIAPDSLREAAERKAAKDYPPGTSLIIFLNLASYGQFASQVETSMESAVASALDVFQEVLVLYEGRLYQFSRTGDRH